MRDTIKSLAKEIVARWPELRVTVERGYCNTDMKPRGLRYITRRGKGRWGSQLRVYDESGAEILNHNNAETYRRTSDVREWMARRAERKAK